MTFSTVSSKARLVDRHEGLILLMQLSRLTCCTQTQVITMCRKNNHCSTIFEVMHDVQCFSSVSSKAGLVGRHEGLLTRTIDVY